MSPRQSPRRGAQALPWLTFSALAAGVAALWIAVAGLRPLFNPDEGRYAEIPREMLDGGSWVIPHLDGLAYIEKPPLQYWATALAYRCVGVGALGARLYTALTALGTLLGTAMIARSLASSRSRARSRAVMRTGAGAAAAGLGGADAGGVGLQDDGAAGLDAATSAGAAWRAAAVLAGMLLFAALGQLLTLDMSLTFYMTGCLLGFVRAQLADEEAQHGAGQGAQIGAARGAELAAEPAALPAAVRGISGGSRAAMLLAWTAAALGVLTKGIVAAVIPAAVLVLYSLLARDLSPWRRLELRLGAPLFLLITLPWHWLAAREDPGFLQFFFVHEHLARYLTPSADREAPWWFFGGVFLAGTAPWTLPATRALLGGWRRRQPWERVRDGRAFDATLFLKVWVGFVLVFFSLSDSKLMPYILPAMPALALLVALAPARTLARDLDRTAWFTLLIGAALLIAALDWPAVIAASARREYFAPLAGALTRVALLLAATGAFVLVKSRRDATATTVLLGAGWALAWLLLMRAAAQLGPVYSGADLARALGPPPPASVPIYSLRTYDQSLTFYIRRTVTLVDYRGELDYGLTQAPDAGLTEPEFLRRWSTLPEAYAIMERTMYDRLERRQVPMRLLGETEKRVLVSRR